jgi:hypothetical protein
MKFKLFRVNMVRNFLFLIFGICACVRVNGHIQNMPLNFVDAIENIKDKLETIKTISQSDLGFLNTITFNQEEFLVEQLGQIISLSSNVPRSVMSSDSLSLPNITTECTSAFIQLYAGLKTSQYWALSGN